MEKSPSSDSSIEVEYVFDSSEFEECKMIEMMIENMKKELLWCKLKMNYLERIFLAMLENSRKY